MMDNPFINHLEQFDYNQLFDDIMKSELRSVAWRAYHAPRSDYVFPDHSTKLKEYEEKIQLSSDFSLNDLNDARLVETLMQRNSTPLNELGEPWTFAQLEKLLSLAAGLRSKVRYAENDVSASVIQLRTYPSGGSLYPVEIYFYARQVSGLKDGFYFYNAAERAIYRIREAMSDDALGQLFPMTVFRMDAWNSSLEHTSIILFMVANLEYSFVKYGRLAYALSLLEAGHIAQNFQLVSTALQKRSLPSCGYFADKIEEVLGIRKNKYMHMIYCMFLG
jgi:SagB-type dehydrogenase family enzyme